MGIDLKSSWIVGDRSLDVLAGKNAGIFGAVHVSTGHGSNAGERAAALAIGDDKFTVRGCANLNEAHPMLDLLQGS